MIRGVWATAAAILATIFVSLVLNVMPIDPDYSWMRPEWPLLVLIFWTMHSPFSIGVGYAWLLGLVLDGIEGSPLGQHALALSIVSYLVLTLHTRLSLYSPLQQSIAVLALVAVYQVFCLWVQNVSGIATGNLMFLWSCLTTAVCWPLVKYLLARALP